MSFLGNTEKKKQVIGTLASSYSYFVNDVDKSVNIIKFNNKCNTLLMPNLYYRKYIKTGNKKYNNKRKME